VNGNITATDMIDKCRNPEGVVEKLHAAGITIGRPELDETDGEK
jgi:hypothetical protein